MLKLYCKAYLAHLSRIEKRGATDKAFDRFCDIGDFIMLVCAGIGIAFILRMGL